MEPIVIRIGHGVDIHAFDASRPLILGGVRISDRDGLAGHSDADAVLHAVTDAILGAAGAGDIGHYFPSDDPQWKDADSARFVHEAVRVITDMEGEITNIDITIIAEKPKIAPFREAIGAKVASLLSLPRGHVNIKATTTDHLGFIGRGEGLCAIAVALIEVGGDGSQSPIEGVL